MALKNCKIKGCVKDTRGRAICSMHDQRFRRHGDYNYITPESLRRVLTREAQSTLGVLKKTSYKKYLGRHEHRVIMENYLSRKLIKGEIVHHLDGNRHNNSIENLQLMTQSEHIKEHIKEMNERRRKSVT